jgi:N-acetyl-anhydromuramyl-L-alanine amidase AmpD
VTLGGLSALLENVVHERRHSKVLEAPLVAPRKGVMLHYDDSSRDEWALEWFRDPRCKHGYTWLVLDNGRVVELADPMKRTPHAGACRTPNANSVFYGIAAATNGQTLATPEQVESIVNLCVALGLPEIVGHDEEAIWTPTNTKNEKLWGRGGRKVDPTGTRADGVPILDVKAIRLKVLSRSSRYAAEREK